VEAASILRELRSFVLIDSLSDLRLLMCYDIEGADQILVDSCRDTVFSYPATDIVHDTVPEADAVFAVEYLPGQYDQRADSAAQCIQIVSKGERPTVRCSKVYCLYGSVSGEELSRVKKHIINSVECRETSLEPVETLAFESACPEPIGILEGFIELSSGELEELLNEYALAMDLDDLLFTQKYFIGIDRDPTVTEIRVLDTYWSDHCRHTTFLTEIDEVVFEEERQKRSFERYLSIKKELGREETPVTLMDIATTAMRYLRKTGKLDKLDVSEEVNACTVKTRIKVDDKPEDWLFLFKNETHNHPTEIEPFGGAATCVGGGIRDPLSGRSYVYQAMRVTGAADPTVGIEMTLPGKLPQRRITTVAAEGNSSYGNQAGLAAGYVNEIYHPGYAAKRMEIGALVGAAPAENVVRVKPVEGDVVILLGGRTGRDGIGAATGSSKTQDINSLENCGAEVQKGNAPEGRKLQRLFRNPEASRLIKRCNDFGAGGVSVAIGELADGLDINLDAVPVKYEGLDGTEIAISESQERMAVVVSKTDAELFIELAAGEGLEATPVAEVTKDPKLVMRWQGKIIVDIDRVFLNANGAPKHTSARVLPGGTLDEKSGVFKTGFFDMARDLNCAGKRGLIGRFCSTVGTGTLLMPLGGKYQMTPAQSMAALFPALSGDTDAASVMAYGFDPYISEQSPYHGAYLAVVDSLSKLAAAGALTDETYLSFQEYFERLKDDPARWGKPLSALLGALDAQLDYGVAAVGGKDSMSGSFEDIDVPPTLVSFAVSIADKRKLITPEFKAAGRTVSLLLPEYDEETKLPDKESQMRVWEVLKKAVGEKRVMSAYAVGLGGIAEAVFKMTLGNRVGFEFDDSVSEDMLFNRYYGGFVLENSDSASIGVLLGKTTDCFELTYRNEKIDLFELQRVNDGVLKEVFPFEAEGEDEEIKALHQIVKPAGNPRLSSPNPVAVIPVFPGTNGEYDMARAAARAGMKPEFVIIRNLSSDDISHSMNAFCEKIKESRVLLLAGGMSAGGEPDGAGKLIAVFLRQPRVRECIELLLKERDGLIFGVGDGFSALLKTGLLPFGEFMPADVKSPALTVNKIGRYQSGMVDVRIVSNHSPWLNGFLPGETDTVPVSGSEGRVAMDGELLEKLEKSGQIATQYADLEGNPTMLSAFNPFGSAAAAEGLLSPDGRIFGRMGHSERKAEGLYLNAEIKGNKSIFESAMMYFK